MHLEHQFKVDEGFNSEGRDWLERYVFQSSFQARLVHVGGALAALLALTPGATVLDFGGGAGVFSAVASSSASRVLCVDRAQIMVQSGALGGERLSELARTIGLTAHAERVVRVVGDLQSLSLSVGSPQFDLSMAIAVLEYISDLTTTVATLAALTRPGGHLLVTVPNPRSPVRTCERVRVKLAALANVMGIKRGARQLAYERLRPFGSKVPWRDALDCVGVSVVRVAKIPYALHGPRRWFRPNLLIVAKV
jgi:2-polyprenyl-3-methyl-5-hydroxy-6-metoxy-1,4-benzoquinol methylase